MILRILEPPKSSQGKYAFSKIGERVAYILWGGECGLALKLVCLIGKCSKHSKLARLCCE